MVSRSIRTHIQEATTNKTIVLFQVTFFLHFCYQYIINCSNSFEHRMICLLQFLLGNSRSFHSHRNELLERQTPLVNTKLFFRILCRKTCGRILSQILTVGGKTHDLPSFGVLSKSVANTILSNTSPLERISFLNFSMLLIIDVSRHIAVVFSKRIHPLLGSSSEESKNIFSLSKYPILLFSPKRTAPVAKSHIPLPRPSRVTKLPLLNGAVKTAEAA